MKLATVRRHAMSLPEVTEQPHFTATSFRVRGKIFLTASLDGERLHIFLSENDRELALTLHPGFLEKLIWGGRVWGVHAALAKADAGIIKELINKAWRNKAPKTLLKTFGD